MATLDDFVKHIRGKIPQCPDAIIREEVREAAIEFCERTKIIVDTFSITTAAADADYAVTHASWQIFSILELRNSDDGLLEEISLFEYQTLEDSSGTPTKYCLSGGEALLWPTPNAIETLTGKGIFRPQDGSETVPDELYDDWRVAICAGARGKIHTQYAPYMAPEDAAYFLGVFDAGIFKANVKRARGGTEKRLRTVARYY